MPTYAILGATGQTGNALLTVLLQSPSNQIHAYCRSKPKLLAQYPDLASSSQLRVFEGPLTDTTLLANCCRGATAVFLTVAAKENVPGCRIARDTATSVVAAMQALRSEEKGAKLPTLVQLNSASTEDKFCHSIPAPLHYVLRCAMSNVYADLELAESLLREQVGEWANVVYFKPAAISHDVQGGHVLSTETSVSPVSFLDVAAGMIEAGERGDEFSGKAVSVLPTAEKVKIPWEAPVALVKGLLMHFFPWMYSWLKE